MALPISSRRNDQARPMIITALASIVPGRNLQRLRDIISRQRSYLGDVSHELRSPLAVLDLRLQVLQQDPLLPAECSREVDDIRAIVRGMVNVAHDLLVATTEDRSADQSIPSDVRAIAEDAVRTLNVRASENGIDLVLDSDAGAFACIPPVSLQRCLVALLDNAIKHTPSGGFVIVRIWGDKSNVVLEVSDSGDGIRPELLARIFERGVSESAEGGPAGGFGIGLALVHDMVVRNGGDVGVADSSEHGSTLRIRLPRANRLSLARA